MGAREDDREKEMESRKPNDQLSRDKAMHWNFEMASNLCFVLFFSFFSSFWKLAVASPFIHPDFPVHIFILGIAP